ncbi:hypothetical protein [Maricaulis sp.]|uniref:hypothetical protein n=1 Tax=Maricaulis sp. TaxID=1486257 RepID=UPI0025C1E5EA|nr:hypothetical protein [Maricaulis sp.]
MARIELSIPIPLASRLAWTAFVALCIGNALALSLVHYADIEDAWGLVTLFHFDREQNLPTLFSVLLILASSGLAFLQAEVSPQETRLRTGWIIVSVVLALLAIDEFASIHERVDAALRYYLGSELLPYAAWPIPYVLGVAALGGALWRWFFALERAQAMYLILSGVIYLSGAVGVELITGQYLAHIDPDHLGVTNRTRDLLATLEETLEMFGLLVLAQTVARRLHDTGNRGGIALKKNGTAFPD